MGGEEGRERWKKKGRRGVVKEKEDEEGEGRINFSNAWLIPVWSHDCSHSL